MTSIANASLAATASALHDQIRRAVPSGDALRHLPAESVAALSAAGLFDVW
ncbi:MAG TPA: hypothetical protein QGF05_01730 [Dehalococcoidia bacterium]|nr:hypothetical protein [Dehalococcoidia bacterium]